jgi:hypothetical protein
MRVDIADNMKSVVGEGEAGRLWGAVGGDDAFEVRIYTGKDPSLRIPQPLQAQRKEGRVDAVMLPGWRG